MAKATKRNRTGNLVKSENQRPVGGNKAPKIQQNTSAVELKPGKSPLPSAKATNVRTTELAAKKKRMEVKTDMNKESLEQPIKKKPKYDVSNSGTCSSSNISRNGAPAAAAAAVAAVAGAAAVAAATAAAAIISANNAKQANHQHRKENRVEPILNPAMAFIVPHAKISRRLHYP